MRIAKNGESGVAPHSAKRLTQILREIVHPAGYPYGAGFFRVLCHIAKLSVRRGACVRLGQALGDQ